jgi:hypothetical protein
MSPVQDDVRQSPIATVNGAPKDFNKRQTTAQQAEKAEDGPDNPFTLRPLSNNYFGILKKRRELPIHAQRYDLSILS